MAADDRDGYCSALEEPRSIRRSWSSKTGLHASLMARSATRTDQTCAAFADHHHGDERVDAHRGGEHARIGDAQPADAEDA